MTCHLKQLMKSTCLLFVSANLLLSACTSDASPQTTEIPAPSAAVTSADNSDLAANKTYLLEKVSELKRQTAELQRASDQYYTLAEATNFDYTALWANKQSELVPLLEAARATWMQASPGYERIEGIVAGVPVLAEYDVILDAGASGAEDPANAVPFDLTLADGRVLAKPGNLFGVTESTLWGTETSYTAPVEADFNGDGTIQFGESLADAQVLKASVDIMARYVGELEIAAQQWQPSAEDAFTALVRMIPTMSEYFGSWKSSRFVTGEASTQRDFVAISRLADMQDILSGLQVVYSSVKPMAATVDATQASQIEQQLTDLKAFVADVHSQEQSGKRYTPEEADLLGEEAQNQATAITGQISQIAAQLGIELS